MTKRKTIPPTPVFFPYPPYHETQGDRELRARKTNEKDKVIDEKDKRDHIERDRHVENLRPPTTDVQIKYKAMRKRLTDTLGTQLPKRRRRNPAHHGQPLRRHQRMGRLPSRPRRDNRSLYQDTSQKQFQQPNPQDNNTNQTTPTDAANHVHTGLTARLPSPRSKRRKPLGTSTPARKDAEPPTPHGHSNQEHYHPSRRTVKPHSM